MLMTKSNRGFQQSVGKYVTKINDSIWPVFELIYQRFSNVHLMSEFQEDLLNTE